MVNNMEVAILMSTYNGAKYLNDQIDSLIRQDFQNWKLYIRDDGSTDNTISVIKQYVKSDNRIKYIDDDKKGLKPAKSFFYLLKLINADYYFFCDQDDYWLPNKLSLMLTKIDKNGDIPQLLYCGLKCVNSNLLPIQSNFEEIVGKCYGKNRFIGNDMPGCVMLINKKLRDLTISYLPSSGFIMHDWWISLIAESFGKVTFLNKKLIYYRQHSNNTIGSGKSGNDLKKMFEKGAFNKQQKLVQQTFIQNRTFLNQFKNLLPQEYKDFLNDFVDCKQKGVSYRVNFFIKYHLRQVNNIRTLSYKLILITQLNHVLKMKF